MWKETTYRTLIQGRFIRPLVPALARFYNAPDWAQVLSFGDSWGDHTTLQSAAAAHSPTTVHVALKARPAKLALSAEDISRELVMAGRLLRHAAGVGLNCSYDLDDAQVRLLVEQLISPQDCPLTTKALISCSLMLPGNDLKSNSTSISSTSTTVPATNDDAADFLFIGV
jgi:hypothetical protein